MIGHVGRANGAEEDGIERLQALESPVRYVLAGLLEALGAPVEVLELEPETVRRALQHLDAGRDYFVADAIAGNRGDSVGLQAAIMSAHSAEGACHACTLFRRDRLRCPARWMRGRAQRPARRHRCRP